MRVSPLPESRPMAPLTAPHGPFARPFSAPCTARRGPLYGPSRPLTAPRGPSRPLARPVAASPGPLWPFVRPVAAPPGPSRPFARPVAAPPPPSRPVARPLAALSAAPRGPSSGPYRPLAAPLQAPRGPISRPLAALHGPYRRRYKARPGPPPSSYAAAEPPPFPGALEHRTKHIALRYFLARELQQRGQLRLAYVASEANNADIFTKALAPGDHQRFCTLLACFALLDWSCDLLFSPTLPMG
ncbi:unnamed protein product, partial [Closterium sp. NIES-53]